MKRVVLALLCLGGALAACTDFDALSSSYGEHDLSVVPDDLSALPDLAGADLTGFDGMTGDIAPVCDDGVAGPGETDVDCGGGCMPCDVGRACVVDGDCATSFCDVGRCALASSPPSWLPVGAAATGNTPPEARNDLVLEQGPDGNLYAIGGLQADGTTHLNDTEKLDQTTLAWSSTTNINNRRSLAASAASATDIWLLYGEKTNGLETSVEHMTTAPTWNNSTGLTYSASGAGAAIGGDGHVYVAGGFDGTNPLKALRAFNPGDTTLTTLKDLNTARERLAVARGSDGRIYAIGGRAGTTTLDSVEAYSIATNTWTPAATLPEPRTSTHAVLAPDGRIYLPGGAYLEAGKIGKAVWAYSAGTAPLADRWAHVASLAGPRYRHGVGVGIDGRIYVVAGSDLGGLLRTVEAYGPIITPTPADKQAGQTISVSGSNFAKNAVVRFSLGSAAAAAIGTGTTDGNGVLAATTVTIPVGTTPAATRLYASDSRSRYPVSTKFTVDP